MSSDTRFASLKTDPRFRRPKKHQSTVVLDERFKHLLGRESKSKHRNKRTARVDKYGRAVPETQAKDDLRRFYRLEADEDATGPSIVDYARGAVLMASSDEDEADDPQPHLSLVDENDDSDSDSEHGGFVSLGAEPQKRDQDGDEEDLEIDLDETTIATLDAQVAEYANAVPQREETANVEQTRRLAVVNLDWDYVRAVHLYKIFSSLVSPTALVSTSHVKNSETLAGQSGINVARGRVLSVRVYPSDFGKTRMAKEEKEGPPTALFKKKNTKDAKDEEINEKTIFETGDGADYDEDALRKYQLERLRYYYAVVECDTVEAAAHVYNELEGAELERSANVLDLSFVPDDMTFDDEPRDEATQLSNAPYRAVEFVTDALRHSKVKLTWDDDDPERNHILRRPLTKKEIEEADFRAYIASSSSSEGSGNEDANDASDGAKATRDRQAKNERKSSKKAERDRLRTLLLGGNDEEMPEGWDDAFDNKANRRGKSNTGGGEESDVDVQVTFTPGLAWAKDPEDENTMERYQRKRKEKKKKKKDEARKRTEDDDVSTKKKVAKSGFDDEFFGVESDGQHEEEEMSPKPSFKKVADSKTATESSRAELALLVASDNPRGEPAHFDMKAVLKAEKQTKHKKSRHKSKKRGKDDADDGPGETQNDFVIDVHDDRFAAIHDDHQFAIDPTHPQFKKTKSMTALLSERSKRQNTNPRLNDPAHSQKSRTQQNTRSLQSLVESVKRRSHAVDQGGLGKRRKLGNTSDVFRYAVA